jgi:hypothetical protein
VAQLPTVAGFQFREEAVSSELDLADRFGEPVWVPAEWPEGHNRSEFLVMLPPPAEWDDTGNDFRSHYQLRSITDGVLLVVSGHRRRPGNLESGLLPLEGEPFETWTRPPDRRPHIVVRASVWDVHVSGSVTLETALSVARSLVRVAPTISLSAQRLRRCGISAGWGHSPGD